MYVLILSRAHESPLIVASSSRHRLISVNLNGRLIPMERSIREPPTNTTLDTQILIIPALLIQAIRCRRKIMVNP
jgi:hypothetical protein